MIRWLIRPGLIVGFGLILVSMTAIGEESIEEFHAYLVPDTNRVAVGELFQVRYEVDSTAHQFNGYEITIAFDRTNVRPDTVYEGELMRRDCSSRYAAFEKTDSTVKYTHVLLCAGVSLDGPGELSMFTFIARAPGETPLTITTDPNKAFFDAGEYVDADTIGALPPRQVVLHDTTLIVLEPAGVREDALIEANRFFARSIPNPSVGTSGILYNLMRPTTLSIRIYDSSGRCIRTLFESFTFSGEHRIDWDGRNDYGRKLPCGVYYYEIRAEDSRTRGNVTLIR